ncbi:MAG TPA: DUF6027 family protein, partial [Bryobacteraceae bacterium]|nr:DUF6027 family protein [Bryobacteraceae bacterium]
LAEHTPSSQGQAEKNPSHSPHSIFQIVDLKPFRDTWPADDPHANFKAEVACYTAADPLPTIENLSRNTGIPAGCLIRYVLVKYAASGSEAMMALLARDPIVFRQMREHVARAEEKGSDEARLKAYDALKQMIAWLNHDSVA